MSTAGKLFRNGLLLSAVSLLIQTAGMGFNIYLSGKIGAEGMGLFSLVSAAYRFAVTFSLSGIGLTATRMTAAEFARGSGRGALTAVLRCAVYALCFSGAAAFALYASADFLSVTLLHDIRCALSLRILAVSLPFLSVSAAFDGYFTAKRSVRVPAASLILEQSLRMTVTILLLVFLMPPGLTYATAAVSLGITLSEALSFLYMLFSCLRDRRRVIVADPAPASSGQTGQMLAIALPIAVSSYLRSGLSTLREVLIPSGLKRYGGSYEKALGDYGVISGMTMPLLNFPAVFLNTFSGLLMPEMARYYQLKQRESIRRAAQQVLRITLLFAIGTAALLTAFAGDLGQLCYKSDTVGGYLLLLGPLVTVMYLDTAVDSMLKGLNEQLANVRYNLFDSALCLVLVAVLLPRFGIGGYLCVIIVSELFNTGLSLRRLVKVTGLRLDLTSAVLRPALCAAIAMFTARLPALLTGTTVQSLPAFILSAASGILLYLLLLRTSGAVSHVDVQSAVQWATGQ